MSSRWRSVTRIGGLAVCTWLVSACSDDQAVIWQAHVKSPDGHYEANAETIQQSGPGNAWLSTVVKLSQGKDDEGFEILLFSHSSAQELAGGAVSMTWVDNKTLRVKYVPSSTVEFQAVRGAGVTIDLEPRLP